MQTLTKACTLILSHSRYVDLDLFQETARLSFDSKDVSFLDMHFWVTFCEDRELVSWNGFCKRLYNHFKERVGKTDVMKALVLLERWKEEDKLIRKVKYELVTQGLQVAQ